VLLLVKVGDAVEYPTMSLSVSVLPLRLTDPRQDMAGMLAAWIDTASHLGLSSHDCREDLERISQLRQHLAQMASSKDSSYDVMVSNQNDLHVYYNYLLECEEKGLVGGSDCLVLQWESAMTGHMQATHSLEGERASWIWNMTTVETYLASNQPLDSKMGWSKAAQHLQNAASWLKHLPSTLLDQHHSHRLHSQPLPDFSRTFISFWQALLVAQSQRCVYESLACAPRPRHLLVSKLAAAAVPLYKDVEAILQKDDDSPVPALTPFSDLVGSWADFARSWGMYMSCMAEYHQSQLSREKRQWGQELARLHLAYHYAAMCNDCCERASLIALRELHAAVQGTLKELKERIDEAEDANQQEHNHEVPTPKELAEIRGEKLVNIDQPLTKLLKPKQTDPIFQNISKGPDLRIYVELFHREMDNFLAEISVTAEDRTEEARKMLATVNLPHSLTAYRQEQSGGGIPDDLWQRVEMIQQEKRITQLKSDLWELRDVADLARSTYDKVKQQLDFDLESDRLFRQANPNFEGHDAEEVQKSFWHSLANYDRLLVTAHEGDSVLLKRLEQLDTNPKYKLLQFQKSQLDRLLPGAGNGSKQRPVIDTSHLSRLLVELSRLFGERESLLNTFRDEVSEFDIINALQTQVDPRNGSDEDYREAVKFVQQRSFEGLILQVQDNLDTQTQLINTILVENDQFMAAREQTNNSQAADSCIVMIEDAMEEIDQLSKHLKEGKDFYNIVIPKLDKLKQQVGDVSARLTVERLEYDDRSNRAQQEEKDAIMAQKLSSEAAAAAGGNGPAGGLSPTDLSGVDDEKVATLIGMEFDPAKVVEALKKYDNDVDQALNELLSG
jgi:programmed cell death 6-interacting protein